ncbi:hypothetical protein [Aeromicrobium sp.]|uniref:hypothetical protein n=1 Tax=Aeromicrobium sp. TaxID=1871063 RepID=UPI0030BF04B7
MSLRLGAVGVIAILAVSVLHEYDEAGNCLQGSISAYYFTNVQSVFVGALVALGLVMIALWGKTPAEDGLLNLAGLLAPIVAFAPTGKPSTCGLTGVTGDPVTTKAGTRDVVNASHEAVANNLWSYLLVVGVAIGLLILLGIYAQGANKWPSITQHARSYWFPLAAAAVLYTYVVLKLHHDPEWAYRGAHKFAAFTMFGLIVFVVTVIAHQKLRGITTFNEPPSRGWAITYGTLAIVMAGGLAALYFPAKHYGDSFYLHRVFWVEAWAIFWLAVFWGLQTFDRWKSGAPPRTETELGSLSG